jgi:hypothetical protein
MPDTPVGLGSLSSTYGQQATAKQRLETSLPASQPPGGPRGGTPQTVKQSRGAGQEAATVGRAGPEASSQGSGAVLRSTDMHRCCLAVVHTSHWEAYARLRKLVEFRSPRQTVPWFPGMVLLLSLNATERRTGRSELRVQARFFQLFQLFLFRV